MEASLVFGKREHLGFVLECLVPRVTQDAALMLPKGYMSGDWQMPWNS